MPTIEDIENRIRVYRKTQNRLKVYMLYFFVIKENMNDNANSIQNVEDKLQSGLTSVYLYDRMGNKRYTCVYQTEMFFGNGENYHGQLIRRGMENHEPALGAREHDHGA